MARLAWRRAGDNRCTSEHPRSLRFRDFGQACRLVHGVTDNPACDITRADVKTSLFRAILSLLRSRR